ncbi:MAG TPA: GntR family transcriptional regulator [Vicinamibacterales bacterium]|nr:GntR family transcriptional regulator [Vicinamibacterales bacterium]
MTDARERPSPEPAGGKGELLMPRIVLDRSMPVPLQRQLRDQLAAAIRTSSAGMRLPSTRLLARVVGVSRNTVLAVYDDLAADGLIEGRRGAAMIVAAGRPVPPNLVNARVILREAGYPTRIVDVDDADGNPLSLIY